MWKSMLPWRSSPIVAVVVLTTACSVADYKQPVSDFAMATQNAETALVGLNDEVTEAYEDRLREVALSDGAVVKAQPGNCLVTSERCQLEIQKADGSVEPFPPDPILGNMVILMRAVTVYAKGLGSIVEADTAEKVASSVNATLGSVENLAKTVDKVGGTSTAESVADYKTSAGKAVNWLVGQYVAKVQLDGLRRATKDAQPVIADAAKLFEAAAAVAEDIPKLDMVNDVESSIDEFDQIRSKDRLSTLLVQSGNYDRYLLAKPSNVFAALRSAHDALANKLNNDDLSLVEAIAKIEVFAAEAKTLLEIVKEIRAVGET